MKTSQFSLENAYRSSVAAAAAACLLALSGCGAKKDTISQSQVNTCGDAAPIALEMPAPAKPSSFADALKGGPLYFFGSEIYFEADTNKAPALQLHFREDGKKIDGVCAAEKQSDYMFGLSDVYAPIATALKPNGTYETYTRQYNIVPDGGGSFSVAAEEAKQFGRDISPDSIVMFGAWKASRFYETAPGQYELHLESVNDHDATHSQLLRIVVRYSHTLPIVGQ